jgi:hypothetical protein
VVGTSPGKVRQRPPVGWEESLPAG